MHIAARRRAEERKAFRQRGGGRCIALVSLSFFTRFMVYCAHQGERSRGMEYEGQICRPPMERASYMLPIAVGCAYNQCRFCTLFKHLRYRELPLSQVEAELARVKMLGGDPKRIFLGDGNPFGLRTEHLLEILELIHRYFPDCYDINMDATVTNVAEKRDGELRRLRDEGVRELYLGIESGMNELLLYMKKDHTVAEAYEQIERLKAAGLVFNAHIMTGLAGAGKGLENAERTAEFLNKTVPDKIINFTIYLHKVAPLYRDVEAGRFLPASELENLCEERRLLECLTAPIRSYDGFNDHLAVRTRGKLPCDREKMLSHLDEAILCERRRTA